MVTYAKLKGVTEIKVQQICERSVHNEGDEDDDEHDDDDDQYGEQDGGGRYLVWAFSTHKTEASVAFNGAGPHKVYLPFPTHYMELRLTFSSRSQLANPVETQYPPIASHYVHAEHA